MIVCLQCYSPYRGHLIKFSINFLHLFDNFQVKVLGRYSSLSPCLETAPAFEE